MPKWWLGLFAALGFAVFCAALALGPRPSAVFTVTGLKADQFGDSVRVTFAVTNSTPQVWGVAPVHLEVRDNTGWSECANAVYSYSGRDDLHPQTGGMVACLVKQMPPGTHARLVLRGQRARRGLESSFLRLELRLTGKNTTVSLNPFDRKVIFYTDPIEIVTSEFVGP